MPLHQICLSIHGHGVPFANKSAHKLGGQWGRVGLEKTTVVLPNEEGSLEEVR